jgi:poly(3-hydroxybutyrate) depolymerase
MPSRPGRRSWASRLLTGALMVVCVGFAGGMLRPRPEAAHARALVAATVSYPTALQKLVPFRIRYRDLVRHRHDLVRMIRFAYTASGGRRRHGFVVLPRWYDPARNAPLPLVIAPHGRGISARINLNYWGSLPAFGPFALVDPQGQGRVLSRYSWGWRGQIDDLARMPSIVEHAVPRLRIDRRRIYAVGSSMGGQETLLLVAFHPRLLAGAAALDSATNMAARYRAFARLPGGSRLQRLARIEIGGTPSQVPRAYAARSPSHYARRIATAGVPLHLWWSLRDRIVRNQNAESGALFRAIRRINPEAPVTRYVGDWAHSKEMHPLARLPLVLVRFGLIRLDEPLPPAIARSQTPSLAPLGAGGRSGSVQGVAATVSG